MAAPAISLPGLSCKVSEMETGRETNVNRQSGLLRGIAPLRLDGLPMRSALHPRLQGRQYAPGVFAPSGWHCHVWYGSGGATLLITPEIPDSIPGSAWPPKSVGEAVELSFESGENSGGFTVSTYALLFFPQTAAKFIQEVNKFDQQVSQSSLRPFARDSIRIISHTMAEFITPNNTTGLGTEGYLRPTRTVPRTKGAIC